MIVAFDNQPVDDSRELLPLLVGRTDLGHKGTLKVIRDKQTLDLPVTITQLTQASPKSLRRWQKKSAKPDSSAPSRHVRPPRKDP